MQASRNAVNRSRAGKTAVFLKLFAQISGRIGTVVSRAYFSTSHGENVASARRVKLRLLLVNKNKRKNLIVLLNLYSVPRDNIGQKVKQKVIFRSIKRLKLIGSRFPQRSANFYSMLSQIEINKRYYNILHCRFEAVARVLEGVSNNPLKYEDVSGITLPFNYNLLKLLL